MTGPRPVPVGLLVAAVAGTVHAAVSAYWGLGGDALLETLGERIVEQFRDARWLLLVVAAVKLGGALVPVLLARGGGLGRGWRSLCWLGAAVLVLWGGLNTVVGGLVLTGVVVPEDGYDRAAMIGHALLWDPLFLVWGLALALGLRAYGRSTR
ncbi:DUF3995 domain-containing protein [Nocardioides aurantiacus]|uniref:Uncharacterized protein DUF3995 n=1 Tax=Nocardioides aurantiacus TaxID=86796 RepID=A0A3N2CNY6_9ACTN|nr:DUF3995 domain-containing protein [Nocardioides aurantiacus]ROR89231.1 uncharacterized protein DUF3995 [Nocardioides aurantiacus]